MTKPSIRRHQRVDRARREKRTQSAKQLEHASLQAAARGVWEFNPDDYSGVKSSQWVRKAYVARLTNVAEALRRRGLGNRVQEIKPTSREQRAAKGILSRACVGNDPARLFRAVDWLLRQCQGNDADLCQRVRHEMWRMLTEIVSPAPEPKQDESTATPQRQEAMAVSPTGADSTAAVSDERHAASTSPTKPKSYLYSWREVLGALELRHNPENQGRVRKLNDSDKHPGPIVFGGRGTQPKVEQSKLIAWWNGLEASFRESADRIRDRNAAGQQQHSHGRDGTVAPEIHGSVKSRRRSR